MSYIFSSVDSVGYTSFTNPGCLSPLRGYIEDCLHNGDTPLGMQYGHLDRPVHPKCANTGAEIIDFMMDFFPNFQQIYPWMDRQRRSLLTGSCRALMPYSVELDELTSRDMHMAVLIPRWLGEGSRAYHVGAILQPVPVTWLSYMKFKNAGFTPLTSFVMSYIHSNSNDFTRTARFGDQTPFNGLSPTDNFQEYFRRMIALNNHFDYGEHYLDEGYHFWDGLNTEIPSGISLSWIDTERGDVDTVFKNAETLENAFTQWSAMQ